MKVVFVYPDLMPHVIDWSGYFSYGIASLSAVLKAGGHQTSVIHITRNISKREFIQHTEAHKPDLIAFSCTSHMFPQVRNYARWLSEEQLNVPTICGGLHPTIAPEETIATPGIDMICRGEGEYVLLDLCDAMQEGNDITTIRNLWLNRDGAMIRNCLRPVVDDLDCLPFADRQLYDYQYLYSERQGIASFMASRGCPFSCTYCCNQLKRSIYATEKKPVRFRSVGNVLREIKQVLQSHPYITKVNFDDDILFLNKKWATEFSTRYRAEVGLPFMCNARADVTDEATVERLRDAGCYYVKLGIESGNQDIRSNVLNRHMTDAQIVNTFKLCKDTGMITHAYNIVGIPNETPATILDTIKLNAKSRVDITHVSIFQPYPGTKLEQMCRAEKLVAGDDLSEDFCSSSILRLKSVSRSQVLMFRDYFRLFMFCYRAVWRLPDKVSSIMTRLFEVVVSMRTTACLLNAAYVPCNYVYRRIGMAVKLRNSVAR